LMTSSSGSSGLMVISNLSTSSAAILNVQCMNGCYIYMYSTRYPWISDSTYICHAVICKHAQGLASILTSIGQSPVKVRERRHSENNFLHYLGLIDCRLRSVRLFTPPARILKLCSFYSRPSIYAEAHTKLSCSQRNGYGLYLEVKTQRVTSWQPCRSFLCQHELAVPGGVPNPLAPRCFNGKN
jgi:hypothetical protein